MMKTKIYVDTNLISRLSDPIKCSDYKVSDAQAEALLQICDAEVKLVTSKKMLDEVLKSKDLKQRALLTLVATLAAKVPYKDIASFTAATFNSAMLGASTFNGGHSSIDPLLEDLRSIFDVDDAEHIFQAIKNDCSYFLTLDDETILAPASANKENLQTICPNVSFVNPEELFKILAELEV